MGVRASTGGNAVVALIDEAGAEAAPEDPPANSRWARGAAAPRLVQQRVGGRTSQARAARRSPVPSRGGYPPGQVRGASWTPSTATPPSTGNDACTDSISPASWPDVATCPVPEPTNILDFVPARPGPGARLDIARQRANVSLENLQLELQGFGSAAAVRYASWPPGTLVSVAAPQASEDDDLLYARVVSFDISRSEFKLQFHDGSTRVAPSSQVQRVALRSPADRRSGPMLPPPPQGLAMGLATTAAPSPEEASSEHLTGLASPRPGEPSSWELPEEDEVLT